MRSSVYKYSNTKWLDFTHFRPLRKEITCIPLVRVVGRGSMRCLHELLLAYYYNSLAHFLLILWHLSDKTNVKQNVKKTKKQKQIWNADALNDKRNACPTFHISPLIILARKISVSTLMVSRCSTEVVTICINHLPSCLGVFCIKAKRIPVHTCKWRYFCHIKTLAALFEALTSWKRAI